MHDPGEPGIGGVLTPTDSVGKSITTTTTANGSYLFANLTPGTYTVTERDPAGFASTTNNSQSVSVPAGGAATANFGDQQIGTVSGVVFNDLNGNGVQDAGEAGLGGVLINLIDLRARRSRPPPPPTAAISSAVWRQAAIP